MVPVRSRPYTGRRDHARCCWRTGQDCRGLDRQADVVHADGTGGGGLVREHDERAAGRELYDLCGGRWAGLAVAAASTGDSNRNAVGAVRGGGGFDVAAALSEAWWQRCRGDDTAPVDDLWSLCRLRRLDGSLSP
nr:unnamed protein product [Digitaria exilis]